MIHYQILGLRMSRAKSGDGHTQSKHEPTASVRVCVLCPGKENCKLERENDALRLQPTAHAATHFY